MGNARKGGEGMDRETVAKWFEFDYLPRVGAYRKDCKQGCDACMPMHDGDNYCDIDMLSKVLSLLKEQEEKQEGLPPTWQDRTQEHICQRCGGIVWQEDNYCSKCGQAVKWK